MSQMKRKFWNNWLLGHFCISCLVLSACKSGRWMSYSNLNSNTIHVQICGWSGREKKKKKRKYEMTWNDDIIEHKSNFVSLCQACRYLLCKLQYLLSHSCGRTFQIPRQLSNHHKSDLLTGALNLIFSIVNTLKPRQHGRHFGRQHFQMHFFKWKW